MTCHPRLGDKVGNVQRLVEQATRGEIDRIYITLPMRAEKRDPPTAESTG